MSSTATLKRTSSKTPPAKGLLESPGPALTFNRLEPPAAQSLRWRYEFKYAVPRFIVGPLWADLTQLAARDPNGRDGAYTVRSLYLDSIDFASFYDKAAGCCTRYKLRVRGYFDGNRLLGPIKFEIKHREGNRIAKTVCGVSESSYRRLLPLLQSYRAHEPPLPPGMQAFFALKQRDAQRPVINVEYRRRALSMRGDATARITLDDRIIANRSRDLLDPVRPASPLLTRDAGVLEIKVDRYVPAAVAFVVKKYRLSPQSVSKYCLAAQALPFGLDGCL